jgi:hypothetical protein
VHLLLLGLLLLGLGLVLLAGEEVGHG